MFDSLTSLTDLNLRINSLTTLPAGVFDGPTSLVWLYLSHNDLTTLPDDVFEPLTALMNLDLRVNPGAPFSPAAVALPDDGTVSSAGGTVTLGGSGSGAWGTKVTYGWALTDPASGVTVTFDDAASATPAVTIPALAVGTELTFTLTVTPPRLTSGGIVGPQGSASGTDTAKVTVIASTDATLSDLELQDGDSNTVSLTPPFASTSTSYTASVANGVDEITIKPTSNSSATFAYLDGSDMALTDADAMEDDFQASLSTGANTIKVKVTAQDSVTTRTYTVAVRRATTANAASGTPAISGTARVGETLTAAKGTIADGDGTTKADGGDTGYAYAYQWIRVDSDGASNAEDISGATSTTYMPGGADVGKKVKVKVTFTDDVDNREMVTSDAYPPSGTIRAAGFCGRTPQVRDAIVAEIPGVTDCADVTDAHLAAITGTLNLDSKGISALAAGDFDGLTALTTLWLQNNQLTTLPAGVFDGLTSLTGLDLNDNDLTTLPAGVFDELTALTTLWLHDNSLTTLPDDVFDGLTALQQLNLRYNALETLPAGVFDGLTALTRLLLSNNSLTTLPADVFDGLTALTLLWLSSNSLTTLPDDVFEELTALMQLNLGANPGVPFSPTAVALPDDGTVPVAGGTVTLDGSGSDGGPWGTNVTYGWSQTSGPTSGVTFDDAASATPVVTIPALADDAELGFTLTVTGRGRLDDGTTPGNAPDTDTATVTAAVDPTAGICGRTEQVRDAIVDGISGVTSCADVTDGHLAAITVLLLGDEGIAALTQGDFDGLTALERLGLSGNSLTTLPAGVFDGLTALVELHLYDNSLATLPADVFDGLTALVELYLYNNSLTTLPADLFDRLTALVVLGLWNNSLTTLPADLFDGLTALGGLYLNDNDLTTLPEGVFEDLTALTELFLNDNPGVPFSPTADALPDDGTVPVAGGTVTLDGSGSDGGPWGANVTYGWVLTNPPSGVTFDDDTSATPEVTIPALTVGTELTFTLTVTGRGGGVGTAAGTDTAKVTVLDTLALTLDTIATDDTVNIAEKAAGFAISGDTGTEAGASVTVTVGGTELTATSAAGGAWSVDVPPNAAYLTGTSVTVTVAASKTGFTSPSDLARTLAVDLTAPAASYAAPGTLKLGVAIGAMTPTTSATDIASYRATGLPSGLSLDTTTGVIRGTPDTATASTASATVTVTDTAGNPADVSITFPAVAKGDQTLSGFAYSASSVTFGDTAPTVTAPSGVETTLAYAATPPGVCTVVASTGALTLVGVGACDIIATAAGTANYNQATASFTLTVLDTLALNLATIATDDTVNIAEKAAGFAISGDTGTEAGASVTVTVGGTELTATSDSGGAWSVSVPANATYLTGTSVTVTVAASKTGVTSPSDLTRTLAVDLTAPAASYAAPGTLKLGVAIGAMTPTTSATDIASYRATGLPSGLSLDTTTGVIRGTPDTATASTASATVTVTDTAGNPADVSITFPAVAKGDQTLSGFAYSASSVTFGDTAPTVTAPSGVETTLAYAATPPGVCTVVASTGALTLVGVGACDIIATAAGTANYNQATASFTVTVLDTLALNLATIATDDTVNIAEKAAGFAISGDTGTEAGASVTVTVGGTELTATSDSGGAWSVSVPANATYLTGTSVTVTVAASKTGVTSPSDLTRTLAVDLTAPAASYAAPGTLKLGVAIGAMTPTTSATDIASYRATGLPSGLSLDTTTGVIRGTPDTATASTASATVTVTDTAGNPADVSITFPAVAKGDQTLSGFAYSASSVTFGDTAPTVTAPSGVETTLAYAATPPGVCTVVASSGALTLVGVGACDIIATAAGTANYNQATASFTLTVLDTLALNLATIATDDTVNIAEKAAGFAISGDTGSEAGASVTVTVGGTELTATSDSGGAWSVSVPANATYLTGTSVTVTVAASKTGVTSPSDLTRTLAVDLTAPAASYTAPGTLKLGVAIGAMTPTTSATDIASYRATGLPSGLSLDTTTGVIRGTPDTATASTASATVTVTDTAGNPADVSITFPTVAKGDQTLSGFAYSASSVTFGDTAPTVTAPSGVETTLAYAATPPGVCTVVASSGALTLVGVGACDIIATAAGTANYNQATASFTVTVLDTLALTLATIATDDTVNIAEKAAGFAISGDTGTEAGASVTVTVGGTELTATSDSGGAWSVDVPANAAYLTGTSVTVTVAASKTGFTSPSDLTRTLAVDLTAPAASYAAPGTLKLGVAIGAMTPTTSATDIASYRATGLPSGLSLDTTTGVIRGTPDTATASTASATVTVTDTAGNPADVSITFPAVAKGDQTLSGFAYSASSVTFGDTAPTVTAPSGVETTLAYAATPPGVCTVVASTGALTLVGVGACDIIATAAGTANYNQATASFTVTVLDTLALNLATIATDDTVNIAEKAAGFAISGDTGTEAGASVTVTVGGTELTATSDGGGAWSVSVPANATYLTGTSVTVTVAASKTGVTSPSDLTRTLAVDLTAPAASYAAPGTLKLGVAIGAMTPTTSATDIASYRATGLPSGLSLDTTTGVIRGTPDTATASTASATVTVTDTAGNPADVSITFPTVAKGDQTLSGFAYSASSVTFGDTAPTVTAPSGVETTLAYAATPPGVCTVVASTGALTLVGVGACDIIATAAGTANYNQATASFTVTVLDTLALNLATIATDDTVNIAEKAAGFAISGDTGSEAGATVTVTVGGTELTATSDSGGAWSVSVPANATYLTGTSVTVTVAASKTGVTSPSDLTRTLAVDLTAPAASYAAPGTLKLGVAIGAMTPTTSATDIASYRATGLPSGLSLDTTTGVIRGTPDTATASTASATVTVTDTAGNPADVSITFPAVAKGDQTLSGFAYSASSVTFGDTAPTVTAPSGVETTLAYAATPPGVCTVVASTGALTLVGVGACDIIATAAGTANYNQATASFTLTVLDTLALNLATIATDDTVNIAEKAAGFAISGDTGTEAGASVTVTVGGTELTATSDGGGAWSVDVPANATYLTGTSVTVTVAASKTGVTSPSDLTRTLAVDLTAPAASYAAPGTLKLGVAIGAMTPTTSATDIASYRATGLPSGLSLDTTTGVIRGTPDTATASTASATVTVTDTAGNPADVSITFPAVAKGDQTLSGFVYSASSVTFGDTAPTVTAPSGVETTLAYAATPPGVCTVVASTGALTLVGVGACDIIATAAGTANYNQATASFTVTVLDTLALNLATIATDDTVNIAEKAAGFAISGDTGTEAGASVTVTVGGTELTATSDGGGAWSVSVPANATYLTGTSVTVTVAASKTGVTSPSDLTRTLAVDLTAPAASYAAPGTLKLGVAIGAMTPTTSATDIASYRATGLPSGLSLDTTTGVIRGTPDTATASTASATVTVTDTAGNPADVSITFPTVAKGDQTLSGFVYSASSVTFGDTAPTVTAPSGVETTLAYAATPPGVCTVVASTGALTLVGVGACDIIATAAGTANYNQATASFTVTVLDTLALNLATIATDDTVNIAEKAAGFAISGDTGSEAGASVTVTVGGTELTATSDGGGAWSVSVPANATYLTGTSVTVTVAASKTGVTSPSDLTRTLAVDLTAPAASYAAPGTLKLGVAIGAMTPTTSATDIASYRATGLPSGLSLDTTTGVISGTPDTATASTASATVTVTDTAGNPADVSITFPTVAKGDQTLSGFVYSASSVTFGDTAPTVTAPSGVETTLAYAATPPGVCTVVASTGALTLVGVGACDIIATAAGTANYNQATASFTLTVLDTLALNLATIATDDTVNIAEKAAGFAISGDTGTEAGASVTVTVGGTELTATSDSGGAWSVSVPANATYLTGTSVTVTVAASKTGVTSPSDLTRTLAVDLTAPAASYTAPGTLKLGVAIGAMTPTTSATDIASYRATGLPSGLSLDTTTGVIRGTPDTADTSTASATVTVTDTAGNPADVSITFPTVAKGDQTLSGFAYSASSVTFGDTAPTVTAPSGVETTLAYAATPPGVCTVVASTGALTLVGVGACDIIATAAGTANYNQATASFTVTVLDTLALNLATIATDDTVNLAEKAAGFAISGDTGTEAGASVTVTVGGTELTATSDGGGAWSVDVPANATYLTGTSVTVTVAASKTGVTSPSDLTRTLAVDLTAPAASYTAPGTLKLGVAIGAMTPTTSATDIASYRATGLPSGLSLDTTTGVIRGTPDTATASTASATVTVTDTAGNPADVSITFPTVAKGDQTLSGFAYSASSVTFGDTAPTVTAPSGVETTLAYAATPPGVCTVVASTGALTLVGVGACDIIATAAGTANYNQATASFTVTVLDTLALNLATIATDDTVNIAEKAAGFAISGDTGTEAGASVTVTVGGTELTATSDGGGAWSVDVPANATYLTGTSVTVTVAASKTGVTSPSDLTRTLAVDLTAPAASYAAPGTLKLGVAIGAMTPTTSATDIASYRATGLPSGLSLDTTTGVIRGTPDTATASTASATVTVTDTAGNPADVSITFPAVAKGDQTLSGFVYSASSVTFGDTAPTVTAPSGVETTLAYAATPPGVCTVVASTGALTLVGVGACDIIATAAGTANYNQATASFTVTVLDTLALNLATIATDDTVNLAEKAAGFAISGDTGTEAGVSVTVTVGGTELTATSDSGGAWSVDVPANATYITGTSVTVTVAASKTGFTSPSDLTRTLAVDLTAPAATGITLTVTPDSVQENHSGPVDLMVTAVLDGGTMLSVDTPVALSVADGSARSPADYTAETGVVLIIPANQTSGIESVQLTLVDDAAMEASETVRVVGDAGPLQVAAATVTITDDDTTGTEVSVGPARTVEGGTAEFPVTLSRVLGIELPLSWRTEDRTARADADYTPVEAGSVTIPAGSHEVTLKVETTDDNLVEAEEEFRLLLVGSGLPAGVVLGTAAASGTIEDNDPAPTEITLSLTDAEMAIVAEDAGPTALVVRGTLAGSSRFPVATQVELAVASGTARPSDYAAPRTTTLTIPSGEASGTATLTLTPVDDSLDEGDETVMVGGSAADLTVTPVAVTIGDNDDAAMNVVLNVRPSEVREGGGVQRLTVTAALEDNTGASGTLTTETEVEVTVASGGTAAADDFGASPSPLVVRIGPGNTTGSAVLLLTPVDDALVEGDETLLLRGRTTTSGGPAVVSEDLAVTIRDNDTAPRELALTVSPSSLDEGTPETLTVTGTLRGGVPTDATTVALSFAGSATEGVDYTAPATTLTIPAGEPSGTAEVLLVTVADGEVEGPETVVIGGTAEDLTASPATVTIEDEDSAATRARLEVSPSELTEGGGAQEVQVTATLAAGTALAGDERISLSVRDGTATRADYAATSAMLTIEAGEMSGTATLTVTPVVDNVIEGPETVLVTGSGGLRAESAEVTIRDDPNAGPTGVTLSVRPASVAENGGSTTLTVSGELVGGVSLLEPTRVTLTVGAPGSRDYDAPPETVLVIAPGATRGAVQIPFRPADDEVTAAKTVSVTGSAKGLPVTPAEFTIEDDDELRVRAFSDQVAVTAGDPANFTVELTGVTTEDVEVDYSISLLTTMLAGLGVPDTPLSVNPRTAAVPDGGTLMLLAGHSTGTITVNTEEPANFTVELAGVTTEDVEVDYSISLLTTMLAGLGVPDTPLSVNPRTAAVPDGGTLMLLAGHSTGTITVNTEEIDSGTTIQVRLDEVHVGDQPMAPVNVAGTPSRTRVVAQDTLLADLVGVDAEVEEGDDARFRVELTDAAPAGGTVRLEWALEFGDGAGRSDFGSTRGSVEVSAGDQMADISVATTDDEEAEGDEDFRVVLERATGVQIRKHSAPGRIRSSDPLPTRFRPLAPTGLAAAGREQAVVLSWRAPADPGDSDITHYEIEVEGRSWDETTDGPATRYTVGGLVNGETYGFRVRAANAAGEGDWSAQASAVPAPGRGGDRAEEPEPEPEVSVGDASAPEGSGELAFRVRLSAAAAEPVLVDYGTVSGSAEGGSDYEEAFGTLTFAPGQREARIRVRLIDDAEDELDETLGVELYSANGATLGDAEAVGTILDDDGPELTISDASAPERDGETSGLLTFTIRLSAPSVQEVRGSLSTADRTAVAGADYRALDRGFSISAGAVTRMVYVVVLDDMLDEDDETFVLTVGDLRGATPTDVEAVGTIVDDDAPPGLMMADAAVREDAGEIGIPVRLSVPSGREVTVDYVTKDVTAAAGEDYEAAAGTLTFAPGETGTTITVTVLDDELDENDETFSVELSGEENATVDVGSAVGTIEDDDAEPALSLSDARARENAGVIGFAAVLETAAGRDLSWAVTTADGTAVAGEDYEAQRTEFTIPAGATERVVRVPLVDDVFDEAEENFTVSLANPREPTRPALTATGIIEDDDENERVVRMWITRFGRTVATQVVEAVEERFDGRSGRGAHLSLGVDPMRTLLRLAGRETLGESWEESRARTDGALDLDSRQILARSSFLVQQAPGAGESGNWTIWGRGATLRFDGAEDGIAVDGDVLTTTAGFDYERGRVLAGVAVAHSAGDGRFNVAGSERNGTTREGSARSTLTSANPYLRLALSERVSVWGLGGYGIGRMNLHDEGQGSDLQMGLGALGLRTELWAGAGGDGLALALKSDMFWMRMHSDATAVRLASEGEARRARVLLEGAWSIGSLWGGQVIPRLEAGLRYDGGDAETGTGLEVASGLRYAHAARGLTIELSGRSLLAHQDAAYREWGVGGSVRLDPGSEQRGLSLQLASSRGDTASGVSQLWTGRTPISYGSGFGAAPAGRLEAELGYGLGALGYGSLTPFAAVGWQDAGARAYRLGGRLLLGPSFQLSLEGDRRERRGLPPSYSLSLRGSLR